MTEAATGLILRTRALTETSLIVNWLTPNLGRISTVAKGARRPKSTFAGKLDLFYAADFTFQRSRRSNLHTLREIKLRGTHPALRHETWLPATGRVLFEIGRADHRNGNSSARGV
ncbi:MAG: DNA repair protein RecO [Verrucomicrobiota bacterium]